jgi:hypothetical protein
MMTKKRSFFKGFLLINFLKEHLRTSVFKDKKSKSESKKKFVQKMTDSDPGGQKNPDPQYCQKNISTAT